MRETLFSQRLTFHARHSFQEARDIARYTRSSAVEPEHLLLAIFMEHGSLGNTLLTSMGFEKEKLAKLCLKKKSKGRTLPKDQLMPLGDALKAITERAYYLASQFQCPFIGTEHLVYSLIESEAETLDEIFLDLEIDEKKIESTLAAHMNFDQFPQLARMFDMGDNLQNRTKPNDQGDLATLRQYALDLSHPRHHAEQVLFGRDEELGRVMQILARKHKSNPLLIGEPGVGKTALVSRLAAKIHQGDVPDQLSGKRIFALDLALVVAGTNFRGEFEARLKEIIREVSERNDIILFIDEIHTIVGAGNTSGGLDAANILKPALARGDIQCIGATTFAEFKRNIEKDAALERRFQTVSVAEPSAELTRDMLEKAKASYEAHHNVVIPTELLLPIVHLSLRHIPDRFLPDKAFDILDEAATLARQSSLSSPLAKKRAKLEQEISQFSELKDSLIKNEAYDEAAKWHERIQALEKKLGLLKKAKIPLKEAPVVTHEHVLKTLSRISAIPLSKLQEHHPKARLKKLEKALKGRVIGQKESLEALEGILLRSLSNIHDPKKPLGSLLFLGPTGVGKTLSAKIIAEEFFGDPGALIRLDMSEFMERHSVAQILGAPAGYVGYGEGGKLTEQVRRRPFSVILFDEIEKAHPDVFNILLQILDEGILTDAEGRSVSFRNALIILTSNIGTDIFTKPKNFGFSKKDILHSPAAFRDQKEKVLASLKKELRPELLARLDHIVTFQPLDKKALEKIALLEIKSLERRLAEKEVSVAFSPEVSQWIADKSLAPDQGARLIRKTIQEHIEKAVARAMIEKPDQKKLALDIRNGELVCLPQKNASKK